MILQVIIAFLLFSRVAALASAATIGTGRVPCSLVTNVNSGKMADSIEIPFRVMCRVGRRNRIY